MHRSAVSLSLLGSNVVRAILGSSWKRLVGSDRLLYVYKYSRIAHEFKSHEWKANVCLCDLRVLLSSTAATVTVAAAPVAAPPPAAAAAAAAAPAAAAATVADCDSTLHSLQLTFSSYIYLQYIILDSISQWIKTIIQILKKKAWEQEYKCPSNKCSSYNSRSVLKISRQQSCV